MISKPINIDKIIKAKNQKKPASLQEILDLPPRKKKYIELLRMLTKESEKLSEEDINNIKLKVKEDFNTITEKGNLMEIFTTSAKINGMIEVLERIREIEKNKKNRTITLLKKLYNEIQTQSTLKVIISIMIILAAYGNSPIIGESLSIGSGLIAALYAINKIRYIGDCQEKKTELEEISSKHSNKIKQ